MKISATNPLVSVAIITFNQKKFLQECIESVLKQDYKNLEIVVADDASTDGTCDLLYAYEAKYPGKFVVRIAKSNQGITKNSNAAHFSCSGKYIAWMGGDDLMLPGKIAIQVALMENEEDVVISYHDLDAFDSNSGRTLHLLSQSNKPRQGGTSVLVKHGPFNGACSTMVRRSATPIDGFDERLPIASDWLYWVQSTYGGGKISYTNKILGKYRRHENNVTRADDGPNLKNMQDHMLTCSIILSEMPEYFNEIKYRIAELLIVMRLYQNKKKYNKYLGAALAFSLRPKAVAGMLFSILGRKR